MVCVLPYLQSVGRDQTTIAEILMEYGANPLQVYKTKSSKTTPLHTAICVENKKLTKSMLKALTRSKSRVLLDGKDHSGKSIVPILGAASSIALLYSVGNRYHLK